MSLYNIILKVLLYITFVFILALRNLIINCIILLGCLSFHAQSVFYENINQIAGLPSENIYDIYKDSQGFIWCASEIGLLRFDGKAFKTYKNNSSLSISGSQIKEDYLGRIWYQSFDGYFFYVENDALKVLPSNESSGFKTYALYKKHIYRIVDNGIEQLDLINFKKSLIIKGSTFLFCELINEWLYYGNETIYRYNIKTKQTEKVLKLNNNYKSLVTFSNKKHIVIADRSNPKQPVTLLNSNGIIAHKKLQHIETLQNVYLLNDEIWCLTRNGIYNYDYNLNKQKNYHILEDKNVSSYTTDSNNFIWIGSPTNGIYLIKDLNNFEFNLIDDEFTSISQKNDAIYTGTNKGKIYRHTLNLETNIYYDTKENNHILFLDFTSFKNWNFFTGNGTYFQNLNNNKIYRNYSSIKQISKINDTLIGVAATGYVGKINLKNTQNYKPYIDNLRAKSCAYQKKSNILFAATNKGLYAIKNSNKLNIKLNNKDILARSILTSNDTLWGLNNKGNVFYVTNNECFYIEDENEFTNIYNHKNSIFLSSKNAIYKIFNKQIKKINGIGNYNNIKDFEIIKDNLYLITKNKLIKIPLKNRIKFNELPKIKTNHISFNNQLVSIQNLQKIPYQDNSVNIEFDIINFDYLNEYQYYYYINNRSYSINDIANNILLPELQPGKYQITFKIIDKKTNKTVFTKNAYTFTILLPYWKTWWFNALLILGTLIVMYLIYKIQIKQITRKNKLKVKQLILENNLKESRLQLIKSQMNPHFFFNAINNIQSYIFTNETKEASIYLSKFSKLTRKILEFSEVNQITLKEEIEALNLYLELQQMRFKDLQFKINIANISNIEQIKIPTMMYQPYVENAILHGLSHSLKPKKLQIDVTQKNQNTLVAVITDNGIGRAKSIEINRLNASKPQSFATKANLERIQLLNKNQYKITVKYTDLYAEDEESNGTQVTIKIEL